MSWDDAQRYIRRLNEKTNTKKYSLPSEAQWEYAARAGSSTKWSFGDDESLSDQYASSGAKQTQPVGQKKPNAFGLYDIHGNVWELVQDIYHVDYRGAPTNGDAWLSGNDHAPHVIRGGSWFNEPALWRSTSRSSASSGRDSSVGFRVARTP